MKSKDCEGVASKELMEDLTKRERELLTRRENGELPSQIASDLGMTRRRAQQIIHSAEEKATKAKKWKHLRELPTEEQNEQPISDLGIKPLHLLALGKADIMTIGDLADRSPQEIRDLRGIGKRGYAEIVHKMKKLGRFQPARFL